MSGMWLKALSVVLFLFWIAILIRMRKASNLELNELSLGLYPEEAICSKIKTPDQEIVEEIHVETEVHSFERWEEVLTKGEENCSTIIESPRWHDQQLEYNTFKMVCKAKNISIVSMDEIEKNSHRPIVHFDDPALMPFLWEKGYHIQLVKGKSLVDLMKEVYPFSLIILSVKDDGSQALNHKWQEALEQFGVRSLTREHLRNSYVNIIWKKNDNTYVTIYEELTRESLYKQYKQGNKINDYTIPIDLEVSSAGLTSGNYSSIKIDGQEYSPNLRGINIVIYDLIDSKVEAVHRVDTFVSIYEDTSIYRAQLKVELNEL